MQVKTIMSSMLMVASISMGATTALAEQAALTSLNNATGLNITTCTTCHTTSAGPTLALLGIDFKASGGTKANNYSPDYNVLGLLDSDGDGINNALEVFSGSNPNVAYLAPEAMVDGYTWAIQQGGGVMAIASAPMTPADLYAQAGLTLGQGQIVLGGSGTQLTLSNTAAVTIAVTQKATGTVKVHQIQVSTGATSSVTPTVTTTGSVTFTPMAVDIYAVIESGDYIDPTTLSNPADEVAGGGCLTASITTPLMLLFGILTLGFIAGRKKD